jgi:hypothetical protein
LPVPIHIANMWLAGCIWDDVLKDARYLGCGVHQRQALYRLWVSLDWDFVFNCNIIGARVPNPCDSTKHKIRDRKK